MEREDPLTIAFVVYGELDERSGGYLYDSRLKTVLEERGHRVVPVSLKDGSLLGKILQNGRRLLRMIDGVKPDMVLIDELNHPSVFLSTNLLRRNGYRVVVLVHHLRCRERVSSFGRRLHEWMERRTLTGPDGYILNSPATADSVRELIGADAVPGVTATPGAENPYLEPRVDPGAARFLFVGNIIPRKGLDRLIRALTGLSGGGWSLDVCGDENTAPAYARQCRRMAADSVRTGRIRFHGRLDPGALEGLRRSCDILAVPSDHEGFGIVYLEAMRAAMVPVASADGGAGTLIRDGIDGFLVPPEDGNALRSVIQRLVDSPDLRRNLSESALRRAREFPDWNTSMTRAAQFLEGIA